MATTFTHALRPLAETGQNFPHDIPDIRGRTVIDSQGDTIGEVDELLVDEDEHHVRFMRVKSGGFIGLSGRNLLLPINTIAQIAPHAVHVNTTLQHVEKAPYYGVEHADRDYYGELFNHYGLAPFWSETYSTREPAAVVGVFDDAARAEQAVNELRTAGFTDEQIGFVSQNRNLPGESNQGDAAAEGAVGGAITGGSIATLWGLAVAAGLLPAIGPVIAGGAIVALAASAAAGAATGSVVGFLIGLGIPETEASHYHRELEAGRILVTVRPNDRVDEATTILQRHGAFTDSHMATPY